MKPVSILFFVILSIIFFSCKKDKDDDNNNNNNNNPVVDLSDYYPLAVGNYWVYQWYDIDSNGIATPSLTGISVDTFSVIDDTLINGISFYVFEMKQHKFFNSYNQYLRDSSNHLIDNFGTKFFSAINFSDTFSFSHNSQTGITEIRKMISDTFNVNTPIGNYKGLSCRTAHHHNNPVNGCNGNIQNFDRIFSYGIGMVVDNIYFASTCKYRFERRLIAYHLN
jgi:hypothetical protein